jgi:hypothetical protein
MKPSNFAKQSVAMDSLSWRIAHEWNRAKNDRKTMDEMHKVWQYITSSPNYQCLAVKRKETIFFLWHHVRTQTLAQNEMYGRWLHGKFYTSWSDLPERYKASDTLLKRLPSGHFWLDENGQATMCRYFVPSDSVGEDRSHFTAS